MNDFNPGPGWREIDNNAVELVRDVLTLTIKGTRRRWVREEPVPPLPTEPGYYMADSTADYTGCVYRLDRDDDGMLLWDDTFGNPQDEDDIRRALPLTRLEPRAVTAKAVVDRVLDIGIPNDGSGVIRAAIRAEVGEIERDYGVES